MRKMVQKAVMVAAMGIALSGCAAIEGRESTSQYVDDTTITTRIKADILADSALPVMQISVETMQGTVQLSGFVDSAAIESRVVQIARNEKGVKNVKDSLVVRSK